MEGLTVIADFQGKALDDASVQTEYKEIRDAVLADVRRSSNVKLIRSLTLWFFYQRAVGDRSYTALWRRYKGRVMIAMSSQLFAQLVSQFEVKGT